MAYKNVPVSPEVHAELYRLAAAHHWTLGYTVEYLLDLATQTEKLTVIDVSTLPAPEGGEEVTLVTVKESEK